MAISLISKVFPLDIQTGSKFVLVAICETASDDGECFMCIETIAYKCGMSVRAVQGHISNLEKIGFLRRDERPGRSSIFSINLKTLDEASKHPLFIKRENLRKNMMLSTPAESAPLIEQTPAESAPTPAESAPITFTKQINQKPYAHSAREAPDSAADPDSPDLEIFPEIQNRELVQSWMVICRTKKVPVNQEACGRIRAEAKISGIPIEQALTICRDKKWAGFKNSWLANLRKPATTTPLPGEKLAASHQPARIDVSTPSEEQWQRNKARLTELQKFKRVYAEA